MLLLLLSVVVTFGRFVEKAEDAEDRKTEGFYFSSILTPTMPHCTGRIPFFKCSMVSTTTHEKNTEYNVWM